MELSDAMKSATVKVSAKNSEGLVGKDMTSAVTPPSQSNDLMASFFRLGPTDLSQEVNGKLAFMHEWASERADSEEEVVNILRDVKYRLGAPNPGMRHIDHMYNYIKLRQMSERSELRAKSMEQ